MKKRHMISVLTGMFLLISGVCYSCAYHNKSAAVLLPGQKIQSLQEDNEEEAVSPEAKVSVSDPGDDGTMQTLEKPLIYVHICGAVEQPGVYQVSEDARLIDVITLSGGLTKEAAGDYINQAEPVSDGQRYYIPSTEDVADLSGSDYMQGLQGSFVDTKASYVNINTATKEQLMSLPGIGEAKAGSIIAYRDANGAFQAVEELMNIPGIKEGLFNQVSSMIRVK